MTDQPEAPRCPGCGAEQCTKWRPVIVGMNSVSRPCRNSKHHPLDADINPHWACGTLIGEACQAKPSSLIKAHQEIDRQVSDQKDREALKAVATAAHGKAREIRVSQAKPKAANVVMTGAQPTPCPDCKMAEPPKDHVCPDAPQPLGEDWLLNNLDEVIAMGTDIGSHDSLAYLAADKIRTLQAEIKDWRRKRFNAQRVDGASHGTYCSIWGDNGQGGTLEGFPEPLPCNCGALRNFEQIRVERVQAKLEVMNQEYSRLQGDINELGQRVINSDVSLAAVVEQAWRVCNSPLTDFSEIRAAAQKLQETLSYLPEFGKELLKKARKYDQDYPLIRAAVDVIREGREIRAERDRLREANPDDLRSAGWNVAVHNDYRQNGEIYTFWLFTKDGRSEKGEGKTDAEALNLVRKAALASPQKGASAKVGRQAPKED